MNIHMTQKSILPSCMFSDASLVASYMVDMYTNLMLVSNPKINII